MPCQGVDIDGGSFGVRIDEVDSLIEIHCLWFDKSRWNNRGSKNY